MIGLAFGIGVGFGIAAWRNVAPIPHAESSVAVAVLLAAVWIAWRAGKRHRGSSATAVAIANARADAAAVASGGNSAVQVVVVADGARARAVREFGGLDSVAWQGGRLSAAELLGDDVGEFDDAEPAELLRSLGVERVVPARRGSALPADPLLLPGSGEPPRIARSADLDF